MCKNGDITRFYVGDDGLPAAELVNTLEGDNGHGAFSCYRYCNGDKEVYHVVYRYCIYANYDNPIDDTGTIEFFFDSEGARFTLETDWCCYTQGGGYEVYRLVDNAGHVIFDYKNSDDDDEYYYSPDGRYEAETMYYLDYELGWTRYVELRFEGCTLIYDSMYSGS